MATAKGGMLSLEKGKPMFPQRLAEKGRKGISSLSREREMKRRKRLVSFQKRERPFVFMRKGKSREGEGARRFLFVLGWKKRL